MPGGVPAEQDIGLIYAVNRAISRHLATDDVSDGRQEVHDREHRVLLLDARIGSLGCFLVALPSPL